jgi:DNA-binding CsgD family transcriptional regulator
VTGEEGIPLLAYLRGEALLALGRVGEATSSLRKGARASGEHGVRSICWLAYAKLGHVLTDRGDRETAEAAFATARSIVDEIALKISDEAQRALFLREADALFPSRGATSQRDRGTLTRRELEVAVLIARGHSNREIAQSLSIGERTVESHVTNILSRLGFTNRAEIAVWTVSAGLHTP